MLGFVLEKFSNNLMQFKINLHSCETISAIVNG
jgi:hypothetical protein